MTLDIRLPMALLFTLIGMLLVAYGITHASISMAAGWNVNADWGAVLIIFGVSMGLLAHRHATRLRRGAA
jgi:ABC-type transport system involved in multi-copper enzyme maturation permease subunit